MPTPLLTTKLACPPARPGRVARPRLLAQLDACLRHKLTLISAPAGYGKTTLISTWVRRSRHPVAWLSLDESDNMPARFWAYVLAALQTLDEGIVTAPVPEGGTGAPHVAEARLTELSNEIAGSAGPLILVLDDMHLVTDPVIHDGLAFLLAHAPPQLHVVVATRVDPPWPLARFRARREMAELRADHLRFTHDETLTFLKSVMALDLAPEDVAMLETGTEGWIAGLQMAALALQGQVAAAAGNQAAALLRHLNGNHRYILDYLAEEVLDRQAADRRDFLLKTSILDQLGAELCDAVTGRTDSRQHLAALERENLFLIPLDGERRWYRYHHLFKDVLQRRLTERIPDAIPPLHAAAAGWYAAQGMPASAVTHALRSGNVDRAETLIAGNALALIYRGELASLTHWLDALPNAVVLARPRLGIALAWALAYAGQLDSATARLAQVEDTLNTPRRQYPTEAGTATVASSLQGAVLAIRAYIALLRGDPALATRLTAAALDRVPAMTPETTGWTLLVMGCAQRSTGDLAAAARTLAAALDSSRAADNVPLSIDVLWEQAMLDHWQGRLRDVMRTCDAALHRAGGETGIAGRQLPVVGYLYALMANVACQWNEVTQATRYARTGLDICKRWGQADALVISYLYLSNVHRARGELQLAQDAIQEARKRVTGLGSWYAITVGAFEARLQLARGDLPAAARWVPESGLRIDEIAGIEFAIAYLVFAKVLIAQQRLDDAAHVLAQVRTIAEAAGATGSVLGTLVLEAVLLQRQNRDEHALETLAHALALGEPHGYVRVFVDEGPPMRELLRSAIARGVHVSYATALLATLEAEAGSPFHLTAADLPPAPPLSAREREVLALLATHLTSSGIAEVLIISTNTVRTHIKAIYSKLGVHSRRDAIARARDLGLLSHLMS